MTAITPDMVSEIAQEIWGVLLAVDEPSPLLPANLSGEDVMAMVHISGEWDGTVCISCSRAAACTAASVMLGIAEQDVTREDVADAMGEIVNVVGGNLKSLLPGPSALSLPFICDDGTLEVPGHLELCQQVRFSWMEEPVVISVWATPDDGKSAA